MDKEKLGMMQLKNLGTLLIEISVSAVIGLYLRRRALARKTKYSME